MNTPATPSPRAPRNPIVRLSDCSVISRSGFSLIELLVVIAIIGVLAGILLSSFSGGTDSARAAKCLNNMRNLAQGAMSYAASGRRYNKLPLAGSRAVVDVSGSGGLVYVEQPGWISWLSQNDEYGTRLGRNRPKNFINLDNVSAYSDDDRKATFALTNGTMWVAVDGNMDTYVCPFHRIQAQKKGAKVWWSYVMNSWFGYDHTNGGGAAGLVGDVGRSPGENSLRADRRLMFAELPIFGNGMLIDEGGKISGASYPTGASTENDCVLQYKAYEFAQKWKGKAEKIAFNHKSNKKFCAHVAFADGHTEKLIKPEKGGVNEEQLTALLCAGKDLSYEDNGYTWINSNDKSE